MRLTHKTALVVLATVLLLGVVLLWVNFPTRVETKVLARLETDEIVWSRVNPPEVLSKDPNDLMSRPGGRIQITFNNKAGREFDAVSFPVPDRDARTVVYRAREGKDWYVVLGETIFGPYEFVSHPKFDFDTGTRAEWVAFREGKRIAVLDGEEQAEAVRGPAPVPEVKTPAKRDVRRESRSGKMRVVIDGIPGTWYAGILEPFVSPDGQQVAYIAYEGKGGDAQISSLRDLEAKFRVVAGGRISPSYAAASPYLKWSEDSTSVKWTAHRGHTKLLIQRMATR